MEPSHGLTSGMAPWATSRCLMDGLDTDVMMRSMPMLCSCVAMVPKVLAAVASRPSTSLVK